MVQNVHLMQTWLKVFERNLEIIQEDINPKFRCFISSEPPPLPEMETIPESILQNSIKDGLVITTSTMVISRFVVMCSTTI
jgi:dynein heavy chain